MPMFAQLTLRAEHWKILDAIDAQPNGVATQKQIQEHYGTAAMMERLEELYESGHIINVLVPVSMGRAPQRKPHDFQMSPEGRQNYERNRKVAPQIPQIHDDPTPPSDEPARGRPPGSSNKVKESDPQPADASAPSSTRTSTARPGGTGPASRTGPGPRG